MRKEVNEVERLREKFRKLCTKKNMLGQLRVRE